MNPALNTQAIPLTELILDEVQLQDFSQSIVLPDYEPEIFRVISCAAYASVKEHSVKGTRLSYELSVEIRVIYCGENPRELHCAVQTAVFSRTADIQSASGISLCFTPNTDHVVCRAAGKRRLDIRGTVSVRVRAAAERIQEVITDASAEGLQLRRKNIDAVSEIRHITQNITITEDITTDASRPPLELVLRTSARAVQGECSVIAGKLVLRGEVLADILCRFSGDDGGCNVMPMHISMCPYSRIIDIDGIDESFSASADARITGFTAVPSGEGGRTLSCTAEITLSCTVCRAKNISVVTDAYGTKEIFTAKSERVKIPAKPLRICEEFTCTASVPAKENPPVQICDMECRLKNVSIVPLPTEGRIRLSGMLCAGIIAEDNENSAALTEREEAFEADVPVNAVCDELLFLGDAAVTGCSYNLGADGSISIKCTAELCGTAYPAAVTDAVTDIISSGDSDENSEKGCALRLCYGTEGEEIWEIAKRCRTKVSAIMEENGLTGEVLAKPVMLLIPIVY